MFWAALVGTAFNELPLALRDTKDGPAPADRGSQPVVRAFTLAGAALAFFAAVRFKNASIAAAPLSIYLVGVACIVAGALLRRHCFTMLGDSFTFSVRAVSGQQVVERGAYRYVRHPSYSAGLLVMAGIGLALGNWISLASSLVPTAIGYAYRIAIEEHALVSALGPAYAGYMKRTRRIIPFVC